MELEKKFQGIWRRALNEPALSQVTTSQVKVWAEQKGILDATIEARDVGAFTPRAAIVLEKEGNRACFPLVPATGDDKWRLQRRAREEEARLWDKMEWFVPLWIPMGKAQEMVNSVRNCTDKQAIELFDYHTSTIYNLAFQAVCIAQLMPQSRSMKEIVPLAREAYLGIYSGYRASSIAALIPAIEGSLTRIVSDMPADTSALDKIDFALDRAVMTAAKMHFDGMWTPPEYKTSNYLYGQDERVFAFETFRHWLKYRFFCKTDNYRGLTWLNRHMFAHGTASSWQQFTNFTRLIVALTTLAAIESWYDETHQIGLMLPEMNEDSVLLWQQAQFQVEAQSYLKIIEEQRYHKHGRLVPEMPTDNGVLLRKALLTEDCMRDLVRPLRKAGWKSDVQETDENALYITVTAYQNEQKIRLALLYSCATDNALYRKLAEKCDVILFRGAPHSQETHAHGVSVHVGPVLGWQPPRPQHRKWWQVF